MKLKNLKFPVSFIKSKTKNIRKAALISAIGLLITVVFIFHTKYDVEDSEKHDFDLITHEIKNKILSRLSAHSLFLQSSSAFITLSDTVSRADWKFYVENSKIARQLPGFQGLGYNIIIAKNNLKKHIEHIRRSGFTDYTLKPAGDRNIYTSIIYIEPCSDKNLKAIGYDTYSNAVRKKAMDEARDSDCSVFTDKLTLIQEDVVDVQAGIIMYHPVYRKGLPHKTTEERRKAIIGWVSSPYRMNDLMQDILGCWNDTLKEKIRLQIFSNLITDSSLLFDSRQNTSNKSNINSATEIIIPVKFYGTQWFLKFTRSDNRIFYFQNKVLLILISGLTICLLIFLLSLSLFNTNAEALRIAEQLTLDLKESEERFKNLFQFHGAVMLLIELDDGKIIDANIAASEFYGYSVQTLRTMSINDLNTLSPEQTKEIRNQIAKKSKNHFVFTHKLAGGDLRFVDTYSSEINFGEKNIIFAIMHDITEQKQLETALENSEMKFRTIADFTYDWEFWLSPEKQFLYVSPSCERITGYMPNDFIENPELEIQIIYPEDHEFFQNHIAEINNNKTSYDIDFRIINKSGEIRWINHICRPVYDTERNYIGIRGSNRDITERKQAELTIVEQADDLTKLNADKDRFISILAHDLRNPFNTILGFLQLLSANVRKYDIEKTEQQINIINNSAKNTFRLLEDILLWAKVQAGKISFDPQTFNFSEICKEVVEVLKPNAQAKEIEIRFDAEKETDIFVDIHMLKTILRNLISNAVKFSNPGGKIEITVEQNQRENTISVADSGIGIQPEILPKLFDISQINTTLGTAQEKGTGLGLVLCKELIEKHGGRIWVESQIGKGSKFQFTIPFPAA
jgi:PAS domain S-box-containing protein